MLKNLLGIVSMLLFCSFAVQEQDKQSFGSMLSDAAIELTKIRVIYDPNYYVMITLMAICRQIEAYVLMWW